METLERTTGGFFNSVGFKLALIGVLTLLLLIPASMILDLIREREQRRTEAINEVSSIWGYSQTLTGPFLTIPYYTTYKTENGYSTATNYAHFLPEKLKVTGTVLPEVRHRGIFKVVTYRAMLNFSGTFSVPDMKDLVTNEKVEQDSETFIEIGIPDMRGIKKDILIHWEDTVVSVIPGLKNSDIAEKGVHGIVSADDKKFCTFSFDIELNGSYSLNFIPLGKETDVNIASSWESPSFNGAFLPDNPKIDKKGFNAFWHILQLNRNFPQQWINNQYSVDESSFGVELITPVDTYQKSERSAKYAILFIGLTFLVFFFAEVMTKTRIHAVNYLLSGFALCIFYSLLIALAEHIPFNLAYLISSLTIIVMIGAFSKALFKKWQVTRAVVLTLCVLYVFLFVILQLMDYSLLFGNIGLVLILGLIMYFSRKIDWYSPVKSLKNNDNFGE